MAYRAPEGRTFRLGRRWRTHLDAGVAVCGVLSGVFVMELPLIVVPVVLTTSLWGVARLATAAPRTVEIDRSEVRLRWWARRTVTLGLSAMRVQLLPEEIVLVAPGRTCVFFREDFGGDDFDTCAQLLEHAASECVRKVPIVPARRAARR